MNIINKAKDASEAFKNYLKTDFMDVKLCERIYGYIQNIENLTNDERDDLDQFINDNLYDEVHLADIYLVTSSRETLNKRLKRMIPFTAFKLDNVREAKGDILNVTKTKQQEITVNVKRKTYVKAA